MSFFFNNPQHQAPLPNPQSTTPGQYYLVQTLSQVVRQPIRRRAAVPHPYQDMTRSATRVARRHRQRLATLSNVEARRARAWQRDEAPSRRLGELQRKLEEQKQSMMENIERYGISHPKEMIISMSSHDFNEVVQSTTPEQRQALREYAVELQKANEAIPSHVARSLNVAQGHHPDLPLEIHTFTITVR